MSRKIVVVLVVTAALLAATAAGAWVWARSSSPEEVRWRVAVVERKLKGELPDIPWKNLLDWLRPGSPLYLANLAENPNPHAAIINVSRSTKPDDIKAGRELYGKMCGQCHGENAQGNAGPSLITAVGSKSEWNFFATTKFGRPGTAMLAQPLADREIWRIHDFLRSLALPQLAAQEASMGRAVEVRSEDVLAAKPTDWLTYAGNYLGHRHSELAQLTKKNVVDLRMAWVAQLRATDTPLQGSPIVANGIMFMTQSRDGVTAIDAETGKVLWNYRRPVPENLPLCCGSPNRGAAIMGNTVYLTTLDAHLIAVDASTGKQRWDTKVADPKDDYTMTGAPLALADRVIVGMAGGEFGARGFLAAFDAKDGKLLWKFYTIPGPGEPGHETWTGEAWKTGGGPTWTAGAYDAERDLVIWGVGNPAPEYNAAVRPGDNLYTNSVIALKGDTGRLQWHYQFTPNDDHDWDAVQQPILAEIPFKGGARPVVLWANRNAFFYAIDRTDGTFLYAKPFVKQNWNEGFDERGRPKMSLSARGSATGSLVWPTVGGATNWWPPSYDRQRGLVYVPTVEAASLYFQGKVTGHVSGEWYGGSSATYAADQPAAAFIKAISAETGDVRWTRTLEKGAEGVLRIVGGVLSTRGGLVFSGHRERFFALDADTGEELWSVPLGARISGPPVSFEVAGRQYVAVAAGNSLFAFSLPSHRLP